MKIKVFINEPELTIFIPDEDLADIQNMNDIGELVKLLLLEVLVDPRNYRIPAQDILKMHKRWSSLRRNPMAYPIAYEEQL
jgi:hypothetical protein